MGERRGAYKVLVEKPEGRKPLEISRRKWEDNIKINIREVVWWNELDRPDSGQEQMAGTCECGNEHSIQCCEFLDWAKDLLASQEGLCSIELVDV
jgi:hypothetical protein